MTDSCHADWTSVCKRHHHSASLTVEQQQLLQPRLACVKVALTMLMFDARRTCLSVCLSVRRSGGGVHRPTASGRGRSRPARGMGRAAGGRVAAVTARHGTALDRRTHTHAGRWAISTACGSGCEMDSELRWDSGRPLHGWPRSHAVSLSLHRDWLRAPIHSMKKQTTSRDNAGQPRHSRSIDYSWN